MDYLMLLEKVKYISRPCRVCKDKKCGSCEVFKKYCDVNFEIVRTSEHKEI